MQRCSVYVECEKEADAFKWIESEKAGYDLGEQAIRRWVREHWNGYLRAKWIEHLHGQTFWIELDRGDFGLMERKLKQESLLLDRIVDRIKTGQENLEILMWAQDYDIPADDVIQILEFLDINSRRLSHRFDP